MAVKPVIDIDVNDAKFQRFAELFGKYQAQLSKVPGQWKEVGKAEAQAGSEFEKILASFFAMGELQGELLDSSDKDNKNLQKKANLWQGIKKTTGGILDDVDKISKTLLKWGLIGFGTGSAAIYGIRAIAESVSVDRRFALGTGLDIGAQQAFARHQGRLLDDPNAFLTAAFGARSDVSSPAFSALAGLGISPQQSTVAIANQVLTKLQAEAKNTPQQLLGTILAKYPGLSQFGVGLNTLQQLRSISSGELQGQIRQYGPDAAATKLTAGQGQAFQNFVTSLDATFSKVERQFERDLVRLLPPIEHFVQKLGNLIHQFLASPAAAQALDHLGNAIEQFATYLGSPQFSQAVDNFLSATGAVANTIGFVASPVKTTSRWVGDAQDAAQAGFGVSNSVIRGQVRLGGDLGQITKRDQELMSNLGFVSPQDRLRVMLAGFYLSQQKGFSENEFLHQVRRNVYNSKDPLAGQPRAASHYAAQALGVKITINNNTGGNVNATASQLVGGVAN